jgi:hypothetical protein
VHIVGNTISNDFPVTNSAMQSGLKDIFYTKLASSNLSILTSVLIGGIEEDYPIDIKVVGNEAYIAGFSNSGNFPITTGIPPPNFSETATYTKINTINGAILASSLMYGNGGELVKGLSVIGNNVYLIGDSNSTNFLTTDGTIANGLGELFVVKLDGNTGITITSTLIGGSATDRITDYVINGNNLYLSGNTESFDFTTTDGSILKGSTDVFFMRLDLNTLQTIKSTLIGGSEYEGATKMYLTGNEVVLVTNTSSIDFPVSNGTTNSSPAQTDLALVKVNANTGKLLSGSYLGGESAENCITLFVSANGIYLFGKAKSTDFPVTNSSVTYNYNPVFYTKMADCPTFPIPSTDNVTPNTQMLCQNGLPEVLKAPAIVFPSSSMPTLRKGTATVFQNGIEPMYQWQISNDGTTGWTDINGAVSRNYKPIVGVSTQYYRRISKNSDACGGAIISTSSVTAVIISPFTIPTANAGGIFNTCVGNPIQLGNATIATGGTAPYTILWDNGLGSIAQPSVSPSIPSVYTLKITDANGCVDLDQAIVNPYAANAGADASFCEGASGVRIGGAPIQGLASVVYNWTASPADPSMSCVSCSQPTVSPAVATTYTLSITIPVTGGTTCISTDDVTVTPVGKPLTPNFAGLDGIICLGSTLALGTPDEPGYNYTWAPGNYLTSNNTVITTFQPGNINMPEPNPSTYYLTATQNGCSFVDAVQTAVIEAVAGIDGCGPRMVGSSDRTPFINETYSWTKISGPGTFTGATNTAQAQVSASVGGSTTYRLTTSYTFNGITQTCTDDVVVPVCGCMLDIIVAAPYSCPGFNLNGGDVVLTASGGTISNNNPSLFTYNWSPTIGLSSYNTSQVSLTDNVNRTYTVTMSSPSDPTFMCSTTIEVNNPALSLPTFTPQDATFCPGQSANIGQATVAGYSYLWNGANLSSNTISNPVASPTSSTNYNVTVTDIGTGCAVKKAALVSIHTVAANAGSDILVCNADAIILGSTAAPNTTYQWSPSGGVTYLNGTSSTSAQPEFIVATNSTYTVLATNTVYGCTATDNVNVTVGTAVPAFSFADVPYCPASSAVTLNPDRIPSGMASYSWSPSSLVTSPTSAMTNTLNPPPTNGAIYNLTVKNASGCSYTAPLKIVLNSTPPNVANNQNICYSNDPASNETVQIGGVSVVGATYSWSPVTGLNNSTIANPTFTPTSANGANTFTVTKKEGGCTTTATVVITVNGVELPVLANSTVCQNSSIQIGTLPQSGLSYSWFPVIGLSDPNIPNPIANLGTESRGYTLTAIGLTGCVASTSVFIGVNPVPAPQITIPVVNTCLGATNVTLNPSVTPAATYNYQWSPNNGTLSDIYSASPTINITSVGTKNFPLTVTNTSTGCSNTTSATVIVALCSAPPCQSITTPSGDQSVCIGSNGSNITVNTDQNTANSIKFVKFTSDQTLLNGSPTPSELTAIYGGTSIATVSPTGGISPYLATYTFVNDDFKNTGTTPIDYYVYAILADDVSGVCRPTQEIKVTINPLPSFGLAYTNVTCNGLVNGTITVTASTGTSPFNYSINDGVSFPNSTGVFNGLSPTIYKPAVKDANGCIKKCN